MTDYDLRFHSEKYGEIAVLRLSGDLNWAVYHRGERVGHINGSVPSTAVLEKMIEDKKEA